MNPRKLAKSLIPKQLFKSIAPYGHLAEAVVYNARYGFPAKGLKVIGVTGTNGKTTTAFLIHRMLHEAGYKVAVNTTVGWGIGADVKPQIEHMTTVGAPELARRMQYFKKQGVEWVILETTSHALAQHRVWGVPYSIAVFTNLTHEHLSYHGTFERYRDAKRQLFKMTNNNRTGLRAGIINADDPNGQYFAEDIQHPITYGINTGDAHATNVQLSGEGVKYRVKIGDVDYDISCQLPGSFNVYNSLATAAVGHVIGLTKEQVEQGIAALESVEGRMTRIDEGQDFTAIVDYAHSPDSFEKLFSDIKPTVKGKLIVVFGSQGGGDTAKRPIQGELAGRFADEVVVCEEDDRDDNPQQILDEIAAGAEKAGKVRDTDLFLVHNRTEAIQFAVDRAQAGDTLLFLGKGHEKTIEDAKGEHPWDEAGTVRTALTKRLRSV